MDQKNSRRTVIVCLLLGLGAIALYAPAFTFGFVNYDDPLYVVNNPHVNHGLTASGLGWAFQAGYAANWHPLTWLSHMLDVELFGLRPAGPHVVNVLLHAANGVLVFLVLLRLTGAFASSAVVAALFACHPLHVESVAWIAERKDVLSTFFCLLALWAWAGYVKNNKAAGAMARYLLALLFFACGLMSKPMVMTLPCVLLLLDWWPLGRLKWEPAKFGRQLAALVVEKVPFFVLSIGSGIISIIAERKEGSVSLVEHLPFKFRLMTAAFGYFRYLAKTFWPTDLGPMYPFVTNPPLIQLLSVVATLIIISVVAVRAWKTRPWWLFGWLWFLGTLLPTMNLLAGGGQPMADRYMYIPSIGLFVLICWDVFDMPETARNSHWVLAGFWAAALAGCCVVTSFQLQYWKNDERLLSRIAMPDINFVAHANYAAYLMHQNRLAEAEKEARLAVAISPAYGALQGLLGNILFLEGKVDEAIKTLDLTLKLEPDLLGARVPLGRALMEKHQVTNAIQQFQMVLQFQPGDFEAHAALGAAWLATGKSADAIAEYTRSLTLQQNQPETLNDLAWVLATDSDAKLRNGAVAVKLAERACVLTHGTQPMMIGTLAAAYAETGRWGDAVATAQKAHDLAVKDGLQSLADRNFKLQQLYRAHQPYRQTPSH